MHLSPCITTNRTRLAAAGYVFGERIVSSTLSGDASTTTQMKSARRMDIAALEAIRRDRIVRDEKEWTLAEINAEISAARSDRIRKSSAEARK